MGGEVLGRTVVLIADDDPEIREFMRVFFRIEGCDVRQAATGGQAIRCCLEEPPDLMFLDLRLPDFDGLEVLERVGEQLSLGGTGVFLLSGFDRAEMPDLGGFAVPVGYVRKPFRVEELRRILAERREDPT